MNYIVAGFRVIAVEPLEALRQQQRATWVPARRAIATNPLIAMRAD